MEEREITPSILPRIGLLAIVVAILGFWVYVGTRPRVDYPDSPLVGQLARPIELPDVLDDQIRRLSDLQGQVVVLNFWASWCTSCKDEVAELEAVHRRWGGRGVAVLGVAIQDAQPDAKAFMQRYRQTFPSVYDPAGEVAVEYGVIGLPETFIIGQDGKVLFKFLGPVTQPMLEEQLQLAGVGG